MKCPVFLLSIFFCGVVFAGEIIEREVLVENFEQTVKPDKNTAHCDSSFEEATIFPGWTVTKRSSVEVSKQHNTTGKQCMKFSIPRADKQLDKGELFWPRAALKFSKPKDISQFNAIVFDIYNPLDDVDHISAQIKDVNGKMGSWHFFMGGRSQGTFKMRIADMIGKPDLKQISQVLYYIAHDGKPHTYYIDNIRFAKLKVETVVRKVPPGAISMQFGGSRMKVTPGVIPVVNRKDAIVIRENISGKEKVVDEKIVDDFENTNKNFWIGYAKPSTRYASRGKNSLFVNLPANKKAGYTLSYRVTRSDWSRFNAIQMDLFNPGKKPQYCRFKIHSPGKSTSWELGPIEPEKWATRILRFDDIKGRVDLKRITRIMFYISNNGIGRKFYVDNLRLLKLERDKVPAVRAKRDSNVQWGWSKKGKLQSAVSKHPDFDGAMGSVIYSAQPAVLSIKIPNGKYRVYLAAGRAIGKKTAKLDGNIEINRTICRLNPSCNLLADSIIMGASVTDGKLDIKLIPHAKDTNWALSSLVVYPEEKAAEVETQYIDQIDMDFFAGSPTRRAILEEKPHKSAPDKNKTSKDVAYDKPFVFYQRPVNVPAYYSDVPKPQEILDDKKVKAIKVTKGEYRGETISIYASQPLGFVQARLSKFVNQAGQALPAGAVAVGSLRPYFGLQGDEFFRVPVIIDPRATAIVKAGHTQPYWISVHCPKGTAPGTYTGNLIIKAGDIEKSISLTVDLLDITLQPDPAIDYGAFVYQPHHTKYDSPEWKAKLRDMKAHGWTSLALSNMFGFKKVGKTFKATWFPTANHLIQTLQQEGLNGPIINYSHRKLYEMADAWDNQKIRNKQSLHSLPDEFFTAVAHWAKEIDDYGKKHGWPDIYQMLLDETVNPRDVERLFAALHDVGAKTATSSIGRYGIGFKVVPYLDMYIYVLTAGTEEMGAKIHKKNPDQRLWWNGPMFGGYNSGYLFRMMYGFWGWKTYTRGLVPWNYDRFNFRPTTSAESRKYDWFASVEGSDGKRWPTILYEMSRMGIYDRRAIYTLEQLIEQGLASGDPKRKAQAQEAQDFLKKLFANIPLKLVGSDKFKLWAMEEIDISRDEVLSRIIKLEKR